MISLSLCFIPNPPHTHSLTHTHTHTPQDLVPESCCKIVGFSEEYKEPFVCNFLGLSVGAELPPHVIASDQHVLLDILPPLKRHPTSYSKEELRMKQLLAVEGEEKESDPLQNYKFKIFTAQPRALEQRSKLITQYHVQEFQYLFFSLCRSSFPSAVDIAPV